jgi:hypothetical protein
VIAAAMMMAITTAMPAMAGNRNNKSHDKKTVVVVTNSPRNSHFDRVDKGTSHFDNHRHPAYRPVVKTCTFRVSRHAAYHHAVAKAERIDGVLGAYWNPRTHEMTVRYDARVTSARHIMHLVA